VPISLYHPYCSSLRNGG